MKYVKSKKEYDKLKNDMIDQIEDLMKNYEEFSKSTSSKYWRNTGTHFTELRGMISDIEHFEPITMKDLDNEVIRDQVLTDEEKELYNATKNYNL